MQLTIDKAGRIVIPKKVRDELHLRAGDTLELDQENGALQLRPVRRKVTLRKRNGRLVFSGLGDWDINAAIEESREERMREIMK